LTVGLEQKRF